MKVNINKHQGGGFVRFRPILDTGLPARGLTSPDTSVSESTTKKFGLIEDTSKEMLKKGGLTSDYYRLMDELSALESNQLAFLDPSESQRVARQISGKINEMKNNKEDWEDAKAKTQASGAYSEIAIGANNSIFSRDPKTGQIKTVSLKDYKKHPEKYNLLSLGDLLNERQNNKSLAFDNSIIKMANNSVGLKGIMEDIDNLLSTLSEYSNKTESTYSKKDIEEQYKLENLLVQKLGKAPNKTQQEGLRLLFNAKNSPGEFVEISQKTSGKGKYLNEALNYIWSTLDQKAQDKLNITAYINGEKSGKALVYDMLQNYGAQSTETIIKPVKAANVSSKAEEETKLKPVTAMEINHNGMVGKTTIGWNDPATGLTMDLVATSKFRLNDNYGRPLGLTTLNDVFRTEESRLLDVKNATFGDQKITLNDAREIIYDGGLVARVFLPVKSNGEADLSKMKQIKQLEAELLADPTLSAEAVNERFADLGLSQVKVKEGTNGKKEYIVTKNFKPFLVAYGYATDETAAAQDNSKIKELEADKKSTTLASLKPIWGEEKVDPTGHWDWTTTVYKGIIAIPYLEDSSIKVAAMNRNILKKQTTIQQAKINKQLSEANEINADPSLIFK